MIVTLWIPGWTPTPLNRLLGAHWGTAHKRKQSDKEVIGRAVLLYGLKWMPPQGKRKVSMMIVLGPKMRAADPDSFWKSTLDALVSCGALIDDNRQHCITEPVQFCRGEYKATYITLEDVP